jgi:soluble lytic murein transglycosylase-like protein
MKALAVVMALSSAQIDGMLEAAAQRHGIPSNIVEAVAYIESTKRCGLVDGVHRGIMQVGRGAAAEVGMAWPPRSCEDEIETGVRYLKLSLDRGGYNCNGVTLYNTGINARPHCSSYGRKVMKRAKKEK